MDFVKNCKKCKNICKVVILKMLIYYKILKFCGILRHFEMPVQGKSVNIRNLLVRQDPVL
jgi:hypothetical protein